MLIRTHRTVDFFEEALPRIFRSVASVVYRSAAIVVAVIDENLFKERLYRAKQPAGSLRQVTICMVGKYHMLIEAPEVPDRGCRDQLKITGSIVFDNRVRLDDFVQMQRRTPIRYRAHRTRRVAPVERLPERLR